jgi:hypothetical protein
MTLPRTVAMRTTGMLSGFSAGRWQEGRRIKSAAMKEK